MITQPIKRHGGKHYLASKIVGLMPPRCKNPNAPAANDAGYLHYVEPYFGGGSVLLANDPEGISEVVNDIDLGLSNFWKVLQSVELFGGFKRIIDATPFSEFEYSEADNTDCDESPAMRAAKFFIRNRQSRQALGTCFATLTRNRTRRGMNEQASAWLNAIEGLPEVHERLKRVVILNGDALDVIRQQDGPRTLYYLDPPYLHQTRETTDAYEHEMTTQEHAKLLLTLDKIKGRFLLSGYHSKLYDNHALTRGWNCTEFEIDNKAGGGKTKRTMVECVWRNYA